jgi:hypothetical protein
MLLWVIFRLVPYIATLQEKYIPDDTYVALSYLDGFFQIFSYLAVVSLCKLNFWKESAVQTAYDSTTYEQPEYAPLQPPQQQYGYQQQPVYNGVSVPVNGNGQMVLIQ